MDYYPGMFVSPWHLIVLFFTAVAFFAMVVGKYPKRTVVLSTGSTFLLIYVIVTIPVAISVQNSEKREAYVDDGLKMIYEQNKGNLNEELVVFVGRFYDEDDDFTAKVYAKNFHERAEFHGRLRVAIFDEEDQVMKDEIYDISLDPGEKKEIAPYFGNKEFETFNFQFTPDG